MKKTTILVIALSFGFNIWAQTMGEFTDPRDGQTYKTVAYENVFTGEATIWMAENLNYAGGQGFYGNAYYAYEQNDAYRNTLGLYYNYKSCTQVCPDGWHLPTENDVKLLLNFVNNDEQALKSTQGWTSQNGTNSSGFNAFPGGEVNYFVDHDIRGVQSDYIGQFAGFWIVDDFKFGRYYTDRSYTVSATTFRLDQNQNNSFWDYDLHRAASIDRVSSPLIWVLHLNIRCVKD